MSFMFSFSPGSWPGTVAATLLLKRRNLKETLLSDPTPAPDEQNSAEVKRQSSWGEVLSDCEEQQEKINHDQTQSARVSQTYDVMTINISGEIFEISKDRINRWPQTLLGHKDVEKYYNSELGMYFFDRNRSIFEYVLRFYQTDDIVDFPAKYPADLVELELNFFRIGWRDMNKNKTVEKMEYQCRREKCFAFFNDHQFSLGAKVYMIVELVFIVVSILHFMLETDSYIRDAIDINDDLYFSTNLLTYICMVFFSADFVFRFVSSLDHKRFFFEVTTWLDIIALIPFYIDIYIINMGTEEDVADIYGEVVMTKHSQGGMWKMVDILRIARVARCFKIIRRSERLRIIIVIMVDCMSELSIMLFAWIIGILISGSMGYFAETTISEIFFNKTNPQFYSILESSWWAQITMSGVGYGDIIPLYSPGMIIATIIIFGSAVFTAIPMTIIIRRFSEEYEKIAIEDRPRKVLGSIDYRKVQKKPLDKIHLKRTLTCAAIIRFREERQSSKDKRKDARASLSDKKSPNKNDYHSLKKNSPLVEEDEARGTGTARGSKNL